MGKEAPLEEAAADGSAELGELTDRVAAVVAARPDPYREVLRPHLWEDERPEVIARRVGRSAATVRSQIHRGLERLRRALPAGLMPAGGFVASAPDLAPLRARVLDAATTVSASPAAGEAVVRSSATVASKAAVGAAAPPSPSRGSSCRSRF